MRHRYILTVPAIIMVLVCVLLVTAARPPAARAADSQRVYLLRERLHLVMGYIERYANERYNYYPPVRMVRPGGGLKAPLWPRDPWTGKPMAPGSGTGSYTYTVTTRMLACKLVGHYPGGTIVVRSVIPYTRKMQNDHRSREGVTLIQQYIQRWARAHGGIYPPVSAVAADGAVGLQTGVGCWPHTPWVHLPMAQAKSWGNFTYKVSADQTHYSITVHYSRGGTLTLRGATANTTSATASSPWRLLFLGLDSWPLRRHGTTPKASG
jgi:hypothetical protein